MKRSLNLMSERSRKRGQARNCLRLWPRILTAVMLVLTLGGFAQWRTCHAEKLKQDASEAKYEPIRRLKSGNKRLRKQIATLEEAERIPLELAKHHPLLGIVGLATQTVAEQDQNLYLQQIMIRREPLVLDPTKKSELSFAIKGLSIDSTAITRLADSLRETGSFAEVKLSTSKTSRVGKQAKQAFSIQCTN